jgi:GH43 family beta-xylosidase
MRRTVGRLVITAVLVATGLAVLGPPAPAGAAPAVSYTNPIAAQRADPHIYKHTDGYYYLTATVPAYDRIVLRRATTIQGLASAAETTIWTRHASGAMSAHIWAPEIHYIGGRWYVYFAAGGDDVWAIRPYVLEGTGANPLTASWAEKGQIQTGWQSFALDATTFVNNGTRYLLWAQHDNNLPASNTSLYIASLSNPWTLSSAAVSISAPTLAWEKIGYQVNEGPAVLQRNGRIFLTYSASATDANYCLGLLTASASANLLSPSSWVKTQTPIFTSNANTSQYGPGHNSFTVSEDGQSDLMVYHDRSYRDISGDPLNDPNRRTRVQKVYWKADGAPDFGIPVPDGRHPVRLRSYNYPAQYLRHWEYRARLEANVSPLADSQFRVVTGLAGAGTVSLESTNFPGYYLRHRNVEVYVQKADGTAAFNSDASFHQRAGLADATAVSFESSNYAGRYLRHANNLLYVQALSGTTASADATFYPE